MPELRKVLLAEIDTPSLPARVSMDERKMDELCESMQQIGLLQPILLKPANGRYEIEAGHRRYMAAQRLAWSDILALVFQPEEIAQGAAMLAENIIREDLSAAEEAILFAEALEKYGLDESGLVARFRRSADYIADRLRLLRDDSEVFNALMARKISFSVARELNKCTDQAHRRYLLDAALRGQVGARVVAQWIADWRLTSQPREEGSAVTVPATEQPAENPYRVECCICGGYRDPWNIVPVSIHKHELEQILKIVKQGQQEQPA